MHRSHYQAKSNKQISKFKNILSDLASLSRTEHANQRQRTNLVIDTFVFTLFFCYDNASDDAHTKNTQAYHIFMIFLLVMDELDLEFESVHQFQDRNIRLL